jgi:hypothetical protein
MMIMLLYKPPVSKCVIFLEGAVAKGSGLSKKDPKWLAIKAVIESDAGRQAAKEHAAKGIPPVCGVDELLRTIILNYTDDDQSIKSAGALIAELLKAEGYTKGPQKPCPSGCRAEGGAIWLPPKISN